MPEPFHLGAAGSAPWDSHEGPLDYLFPERVRRMFRRRGPVVTQSASSRNLIPSGSPNTVFQGFAVPQNARRFAGGSGPSGQPSFSVGGHSHGDRLGRILGYTGGRPETRDEDFGDYARQSHREIGGLGMPTASQRYGMGGLNYAPYDVRRELSNPLSEILRNRKTPPQSTDMPPDPFAPAKQALSEEHVEPEWDGAFGPEADTLAGILGKNNAVKRMLADRASGVAQAKDAAAAMQ